MRFSIVVLISDSDSKIAHKVSELLRPFDANLRVSPHKDYLESELLQEVSKRYKIQLNNNEHELAQKLEEWTGDTCGTDENGIYWLSTINPNGRWDGWIIHDLVEDVFTSDNIPNDLAPSAILTSDGVWHDLENDNSTESIFLLTNTPYERAVIVDCHI